MADKCKPRAKVGRIGEGKIPPQNIEVEEAVLGCLLLEAKAFLRISDIVTADSFYKETNQIIFRAIAKMYAKGDAIDMLTIIAELRAEGLLDVVGGPYAITKLTDRVSSSVNIEFWAQIVQGKYQKREMIRICEETLGKVYDEGSDYLEILNELQGELISTVQKNGNSMRHISDVTKDVIDLMRRNSVTESSLTGLPTGLIELDRATGGLQNGDLFIIAGETSQGKTSLAVNIAQNCASFGHKVGIWSYEMSDMQLGSRQMSALSRVPSRVIMSSKMAPYEIDHIVGKLTPLINSAIYIEKAGNSALDKLVSGIRSAVIKLGIEIAFIDYLQLVTLNVKGQTKVDNIAEIANTLKNLAHSLQIPIVLLSQLSRNRENPRPHLSRLKGSGDIENAADVVLFVWQPGCELYNMDTFYCSGVGDVKSAGLAHVIIAKGRNIGTHEFILKFDKACTLFTDFDMNIGMFDDKTQSFDDAY